MQDINLAELEKLGRIAQLNYDTFIEVTRNTEVLGDKYKLDDVIEAAAEFRNSPPRGFRSNSHKGKMTWFLKLLNNFRSGENYESGDRTILMYHESAFDHGATYTRAEAIIESKGMINNDWAGMLIDYDKACSGQELLENIEYRLGLHGFPDEKDEMFRLYASYIYLKNGQLPNGDTTDYIEQRMKGGVAALKLFIHEHYISHV